MRQQHLHPSTSLSRTTNVIFSILLLTITIYLFSTSTITNNLLTPTTFLPSLSIPPFLQTNTNKTTPNESSELHRMIKSRHDLLAQEYKARGGILKDGERPPPYLSIMCIVKQGGDMIHEFILRNFMAGVDHFYIYDGNIGSEKVEDVRELVKELSGIVSVIDVPTSEELLKIIGRDGEYGINGSRETQMRVNWHCLLGVCRNSTWVAVVDVDEFFEVKDVGKWDVEEVGGLERVLFMRRILKGLEGKQPAVASRWRMVLSNGRIYPTEKGVTLNEGYPFSCSNKTDYRDAEQVGVTNYAKIIVQPKFLDFEKYKKTGMFFLHGLSHLQPVYQEMHHLKPYEDFKLHADTSDVEFYILHYWSRSFSDFLMKAQRGIQPPILTAESAEAGLVGQPENRFIWEFFWREAGCRRAKQPHLHADPSARKRVPLLKRLLNELDSYKQEIPWKKRMRKYSAMIIKDEKYPLASQFAARVANGTEPRTPCDDSAPDAICPYPFPWSTSFFNESTEQRLFR